MTNQKKISPQNLPTRLPVYMSIVVWMLLDRLQAGQMACGIVYTLLGVVWAVSIYSLAKEEHRNIDRLL